MMPSRAAALAAIVSISIASSLPARDASPRRERSTPIAFVHARLIPVAGPEIGDGVLIVRGTRLEAVGAAHDVRVPADAVVVDLSGLTVMPGLVDTHSHVGGGWGADGSAPIQPDVRVWDSIDCRSAGFQRAQAGGITTLNVMSGSGHLMSGQTAYLKNRDAETIDGMMVRDEDGEPMGGMKMANGTNSQRDSPFPGTRSKSAALVREQFLKAQAWTRKRDKPKKDEVAERDLVMEGLAEVLEGTRAVHHHTHRHDDIITVLRLREEFGFRVVLHHVSEGWKVADEIAAAGVPCSIIVVDAPGGKIEARDLSFATGGILERAGVKVGFHSDDWITDSRLFLRSGGLAVRGGMTREGALRALTIHGAEMLDLGDRVGTLEKGKDADFVVLDGDPLSAFTRILETWVEGEKVFDARRDEDRLWAEGGWGAGERRAFSGCCFAEGGDR